MTTFLLVEQEDKRLVLEPSRTLKESEAVLQTIQADDWASARERVVEAGLKHIPGFGWFRR